MTRPGRPGPPAGADPGPCWLDAYARTAPLDLAALFGNDRPVELEIGCGKGMFLAAQSAARPDANFVGIEVAAKVSRLAAYRCAQAGAANVRVLAGDARRLLALMPDGCLAAAHIYFPDPWWKRRHRKRRMVADDVVAALARLTRPGGELRLATDVAEYADAMRKTLADCLSYLPLAAWEPDGPGAIADGTAYLTHFERKFRLAGRPTWRMRYERVDRPAIGGNNGSGVTP